MSTLTPRLLRLEDIQEGQTFAESTQVSEEILDRFIDLSGDRAAIHVDSDHAQRMGYSGRLVHGFLGMLAYSRLLGMFLPGSNTVIHQVQVEMVQPVFVGDQLTHEVQVQRVVPAVRTVKLQLTTKNQHGVVVNRGQATCVFRAAA